jgi:hypothetical protein
MSIRFPLPIVLLLLVGTGACASRGPDALLETQRVVLYQSGVGYLEQTAEVRGDTLTLAIRPDQIDDVLATLVVMDEFGQTATVAMPLSPAEQLPPWTGPASGLQGDLVSTLRALQGSRVVLRADQGTWRGRLSGMSGSGDGLQVSLLTGRGALRALPVAGIRDVRPLDATVADALNRAVQQADRSETWQPVPLTLRFPEARRRTVSLAWVTSMPAWKMVYRAVAQPEGQVLLQGWGVVENVSGADWQDVMLSLTAGTPLSYRYDLSTPHFIPRVDLSGYGRPTGAELAPPPVLASRPSAAPAPPPRAGASPSVRESGMVRTEGRTALLAPESHDESGDDGDGFLQEAFTRAAPGGADARAMQGLFRYDLRDPVTLPDGASALVPLLNERMRGEDVLVWQPDSPGGSVHPYRSLRVSNDSPWPISPAPITIYREGSFVGAGVTPSVPSGQTAFIQYALDPRVEVSRERRQQPASTDLQGIREGRLVVARRSTESQVVRAFHSLDEAHTLLVQVERLPGHDLLSPPEGTETHPGFYMVPIRLQPATPGELTVHQSVARTRDLDIFDASTPALLDAWLQQPAHADSPWREAVESLRHDTALLQDLHQQVRSLQQAREEAERRAADLRRNLTTLAGSRGNEALQRELTSRLAEQDDVMGRLSGELVRLHEAQADVRGRLLDRMAGLNWLETTTP